MKISGNRNNRGKFNCKIAYYLAIKFSALEINEAILSSSTNQ
uniref:Uncharacterized protein n=1 Tax=Rhizophora mucronata TaxID=61149 RepID=A0A2P2PR86_RHIMU